MSLPIKSAGQMGYSSVPHCAAICQNSQHLTWPRSKRAIPYSRATGYRCPRRVVSPHSVRPVRFPLRTGCNAPGRVLFGCFVRLPQRINLQLYGINKCRGEVMISSSSLPLCSRPSREILPSSFAALNGGWSCWC